MSNQLAPSASPASSASKCNADIAPLLEVQERLRQAFTTLNTSYIENASKTSKKSEALIHILSVLQLPSAPPADGDMSKLTPDSFIKTDGDLELDFFGRIINPALKANLTIGLNGLELCQYEQMQAHALECLEQIFTCPLPHVISNFFSIFA
jgi:hypothetical protein